jgi:RNA ligase
MDITKKVSELIEYAEDHPHLISTKRNKNLLKFNYTQRTHYEKMWNKFTLVSRGIIVDKDRNEIIARPFDKFFNKYEYDNMEIDIPDPKATPYWITEKLDGVLIIPYLQDEKLKLSTRGSFENKYIDKAYEIMTFDNLPLNDYSFAFELISPSYSDIGFLVTKYDSEALILIGIRDKRTQRLLSPPELVEMADKLDLKCYKHDYDLSFAKVLEKREERRGDTSEGWVVFFDGGFLVKVKREEYLDLFKAVKNLNQKIVLQELINGTFTDFRRNLPEELENGALEIYSDIKKRKEKVIDFVRKEFDAIPKKTKTTRKDYFTYITNEKRHIFGYLASLYDDANNATLAYIFYKNLLKRPRKNGL